jgi:hypothetical protein
MRLLAIRKAHAGVRNRTAVADTLAAARCDGLSESLRGTELVLMLGERRQRRLLRFGFESVLVVLHGMLLRRRSVQTTCPQDA